jgi:hypothetical protein
MTTIRVTCQQCSFSRDVAAEKVPDGPVQVTCPKCSTTFTFRKPPLAALAVAADGRGKPESSRPAPPTPARETTTGKGPSGVKGSAKKVRPGFLLGVLSVVLLLAALAFWYLRSGPDAGAPVAGNASSPADVARPANFNELLGVWSGKEMGGGAGWTFTFSEGYNVHAVGPDGRWYKGTAAIHWKLGADERGMRVPPGAGVLDMDVTESSSADQVGKTSVGAFAVYNGTTLKLCSGEPGKAKRPESFDPVAGISCFELAKTAAAPPAPQPTSPVVTQPASAESPSMEDDETRAARGVFQRCAAAYRAGNMAEAKSFVSRATLADMERSGQVDMALGMMSGMNIDEFRAHREGDRITFTQSHKQGDATMSMSFTMVKEDHQWKLGK